MLNYQRASLLYILGFPPAAWEPPTNGTAVFRFTLDGSFGIGRQWTGVLMQCLARGSRLEARTFGMFDFEIMR